MVPDYYFGILKPFKPQWSKDYYKIFTKAESETSSISNVSNSKHHLFVLELLYPGELLPQSSTNMLCMLRNTSSENLCCSVNTVSIDFPLFPGEIRPRFSTRLAMYVEKHIFRECLCCIVNTVNIYFPIIIGNSNRSRNLVFNFFHACNTFDASMW